MGKPGVGAFETHTSGVGEKWDARYRAGDTGWDRGVVSPSFEVFQAYCRSLGWAPETEDFPKADSTQNRDGRLAVATGLGPGLLIPGCGTGYEVVAAAERGWRVIALDAAPTPLKSLQERLIHKGLSERVRLAQADLFEWSLQALGDDWARARLDAVYEQTCLCAIDPEQRADYASRLHAWLRPGGVLFACFMQVPRRGGPPYHCDLVEMRELFDASEWRWSDPLGATPHTSGKQEWLYALSRR
ncbi:MAG: methyltransferase domain-containing protein [Thioalkalivibrionaceae bacterium]